jgi:L-ascorbate metabolism protein UlaG (beta-lactamase superfamily)
LRAAASPVAGRAAGRAAVLAAGLLAACGSSNPYYDPARAHHRPDGFVNASGPVGGRPFGEFLRWQRERSRDGLPKPPSEHVAGYAGFPVVKPDLQALRAGPAADGVSVTWIGHATLLVQMAGRNVLIDPHFSDRASPLSFAGPIRRVPLPADLAELPRIDVVLISHSHYDHLDAPTVRRLQAQPGGPPLFVVPLGLDLWLRDAGVTRVERLDWWDALRLDGIEVHLTPAQHWSARSPWDHNRTLWGGFVVRSSGFTFWYSGDTGYSPVFAEVGQRFPGIDLAAIPVGAYEPRWFMQDQHVNPEEAVRIFLDVKAREAMGVHWGTFELTDEPLDAPLGELPKALDALGVARERFGLWRHGETRVFHARAR